ncbi:MAG TPA: mechanosensitive ion channel family protein [Vicinamibacterales bacterium]|nr:mechanosensitive ion channel family protein [Vicinamibacterales bacterium]
MGFYHAWHLVFGIAALLTTFAISALTVNRLVRRKLKLSLFLIGAYVVAHTVLAFRLAGDATLDEQLVSIERLAFAAGLINLIVIASLNPLREDRVPARYPAILQDFIVIGLLVLVATLVFQDKLLTTSAVSAVVLGFALQDTLGNAFAGLAIQSEKPFHVGHWIRVGDFEGRVAEVTWRATKLQTKSGNFVVVPNNIVSKEAITNYSEPSPSVRIEVEVGASYLASPGAVKSAIGEALANSSRVLSTPAADVVLASFDSSAINYRVRFWIDDYARDEAARDEVRTNIYYAFARHGIEIPWPIQVQYEREWDEADPRERSGERGKVLSGIDLFAGLDEETLGEIARSLTPRRYGNGEAIVRQGEPGESMFIICSGRATVVIEPDRREVATIEAGGYFGEMSLLTGDPRTATVLARGDTLVFELNADLFRRLGVTHPQAVEQVALAAAARRVELDKVRAAAVGPAVADAPATLMDRMRRFLRL